MSRRTVIVAGAVVILLGVLAALGWWNGVQNQQAREAHAAYQELGQETVITARLRDTTKQIVISREDSLTSPSLAGSISPDKERAGIERDRRRLEELNLDYDSKSQRLHDLERRWGDRWDRLGLSRTPAP